jgi:hypothetical protein
VVVVFVEEVLFVVLPVAFVEEVFADFFTVDFFAEVLVEVFTVAFTVDLEADTLCVTVVCVVVCFVVTVFVFANAGAASIVVAPNTVTAPTRILVLTVLNISLTPFTRNIFQTKVYLLQKSITTFENYNRYTPTWYGSIQNHGGTKIEVGHGNTQLQLGGGKAEVQGHIGPVTITRGPENDYGYSVKVPFTHGQVSELGA